MYKVLTKTYSPSLEPNTYEEDKELEDGTVRFSPLKYRYTGLYWVDGNFPHYNKLVPRGFYQKYHYRIDPVPLTGCPRNRSEHGIRYGRYAREVLTYQEIPVRDEIRSRYTMFVDPWGFYDTNYTQYYAQPKRDWKRTKVKRQFMRHKGHFGKTNKEFLQEYLDENPFDAKLLEKRICGDNRSKYQGSTPEYVFKRDDGDHEYECPNCKLLNITNYRWYDEPWDPQKCEYCNHFVVI